MKSKVRIVGDSLYPKRHWDKTFEVSIRRKQGREDYKGSVVFKWKNIEHIGDVEFFQLERYRFIQKLMDFYVGKN